MTLTHRDNPTRLRGVGQRCLALPPVAHADVTDDTLELVLPDTDRIPPSVLSLLAGTRTGIVGVQPQGDALYVRCR